ncbi:hypothetical protein D3C84_336380 [compost metagenome]
MLNPPAEKAASSRRRNVCEKARCNEAHLILSSSSRAILRKVSRSTCVDKLAVASAANTRLSPRQCPLTLPTAG